MKAAEIQLVNDKLLRSFVSWNFTPAVSRCRPKHLASIWK